MDTLETQVAKITIGNFRQTMTYVSVLAEKAPHPDCELYLVSELPLFNPAAINDCERICNALAATLRRSYKRGLNENTFESALGEINEELGKLATMGQTNWIGKLNAIIAVKHGLEFNIATSGKVLALLLREDELTDIADSPKPGHPLKTFENFATGKLKEQDILILSTASLSNYISIDKLRTIIKNNALSLAAQHVVKLLEETAGPEVAFASLIMAQLDQDQGFEANDRDINLEEYLPKERGLKPLISKAKKHFAKIFTVHNVKNLGGHLTKLVRSRPKVSMEQFQNIGRKNLEQLKRGSLFLGQRVNPKNFKTLSKTKKLLLIGAIAILLTTVLSVWITGKNRAKVAAEKSFTENTGLVQKLITDADSNIIFKNNSSAADLLSRAKTELQNLHAQTEDQQKSLDELQKQITAAQKKLEKTTVATVTNLASLSAAERLIALPNIFATSTGGQIVSFNINTKSTQDGTLKSITPIFFSVYSGSTSAVIFDGQGLRVWDWSRGNSGEPFYQSLPEATNIVGLAFYETNSRVYLIDKEKNQITNFLVSGNTISKPLVWNKVALDFSNSLGLAIDGNIYVLTSTGVNKFNQGKPVNFTNPTLTTPFSGKGKIFTNKDEKNIYVLDSGNNRVVIMDKSGALVQIITSPEFTSLQDFSVDEKNNTIYLLNNGSLLKATY